MSAPPADPGPVTQSQRRLRAVPPDHPPGVLASRLPPASLHLDPPAPGRSRRLARDLPPPSPEPRRLHARQDPFSGPGQPQEESVSYTHLRAHETVLDLVCRL